ncbi:hypothetical protein FOA52_014345 [Chlamydomonas sp. UWO 241]|nr:hypothetical protein FOA52_014345 [Chlamydomonas sp. UWO 241]
MEREWSASGDMDDALMSPSSARAGGHCLFAAGFDAPDVPLRASPSQHERMQRRASIKTASSLLSAALAKVAPGGYGRECVPPGYKATTDLLSGASRDDSDNEPSPRSSSKPIAIVRDSSNAVARKNLVASRQRQQDQEADMAAARAYQAREATKERTAFA